MSPIASRGSSPPATPKNDCAAAESVGQQRGDDRGVDLAHPGAGQHHVMSVDGARVEDGVRSILTVGAREGIAQVCEFLRDGADQSDGHAINLEVMLGLEELAGAFTDGDAGRPRVACREPRHDRTVLSTTESSC